jgi:hypothetical protein
LEPNKPCILAGSNGTGKTSIATAFDGLKDKVLKIEDKEIHNHNKGAKPEIIITFQEGRNKKRFVANQQGNDISKKFDIFVIHVGLKAYSGVPYYGKFANEPRIYVPNISIFEKIPQKPELTDDFKTANHLDGAPRGTYPLNDALFKNHEFMVSLNLASLKMRKKDKVCFDQFIQEAQKLEGTCKSRQQKIKDELMGNVQNIDCVRYAMERIKHFYPETTELECFLKAVSLVDIAQRKMDILNSRVEYSRYQINKRDTQGLFDSIKTWLKIKPHEEKGKLILQIKDAQRISNGELDILTFIAHLESVRYALKSKYCILVIDELFDYLDEANLLAVQYYLNLLLKDMKRQSKFLFPIILSHLNPTIFKSFYFSQMEIRHFTPLANASKKMQYLIKRRSRLMKEEATRQDGAAISKYMMHFNPDAPNQNLTDIIDMPDELQDGDNWGNLNAFKNYYMNEMEKYIGERNDFDSLAVNVAIRQMIEEYCYYHLAPAYRDEFLETHKTHKLVTFAQERGVEIPEVFYLLRGIYNEEMHTSDNDDEEGGNAEIEIEEEPEICQKLFSLLENHTIRNMIKSVKKEYDEVINSLETALAND